MQNVVEFAVQLFVLERAVLQCILRQEYFFTNQNLEEEIINETMRLDGPIHAIEDFFVLNRGQKKFEDSLHFIHSKYKHIFLRNIQLFYKLVSEDKEDEFWGNSVSCFLNFACFQDYISGEITFKELVSNPNIDALQEDSSLLDYNSNAHMSGLVHAHMHTTSHFRTIVKKMLDSRKIFLD